MFIADNINLLDSAEPLEPVQAIRIGPANLLGLPNDSDQCSVTLASKRGPAFTKVAVKLFQKSKKSNLKFKLEQLGNENAKDFAVSFSQNLG